MNMTAKMDTNLREFVFNSSFRNQLDFNWTDCVYRDSSTDRVASSGILLYLLMYHTYAAFMSEVPVPHRERAEKLAQHVSNCIREDGLTVEPDGSLNDHPAQGCHVVDALGTFIYYGRKGDWAQDVIAQSESALVTIVENHPVVRLPGGIQGQSQHMRFELRAWYWAWRVTGEEKYRDACYTLWRNGMRAYQNIVVEHGQLLQPSLHPDFTWNYACGAGTTSEYATNTHAPTYYCTEPQGFAFIYYHGLKDGVFETNPEWDNFCRKYFLGLQRNLSRAGHTASDLDGYGVHRAWYAGCLIETSPVEAAALGTRVGLSDEQSSWFRWYVERYVDFIQRSPVFEKTGLIEHQPYGHNITTETQFSPLLTARFYAHLARALYEYKIDAIEPVEPPAFASYAWWHDWLRVSTPSYETSFVGKTSLRNIPKVPGFGDTNLGCIHGGSPLTTLFVGKQLLYATSNDTAGLWHVELTDYNGNLYRSCATSFADETSMTVKSADGTIWNYDSFVNYCDPVNFSLGADATEIMWSRQDAENGRRFFLHNRYFSDSFSMLWGVSFPAGLYTKTVSFNLAIPATLNPELQVAGQWQRLTDEWNSAVWPDMVRWRNGDAVVEIALFPQDSLAVGAANACSASMEMTSPGGENSFCPFPILQLRLEVAMSDSLSRVALNMIAAPTVCS